MDVAAGIVLAGGRSSRMGTAKAGLEWHGSTLLRHVTGLVARAVGGPVVVVRAPGQSLPALSAEVEVVEDPREGLGPLQGLATGLAAVSDRAEAAFACSTDLPFLHPAFARLVLRALDSGADIGLPVVRGYPQPLAAAYRTTLADLAARMVATQRLRLTLLLDECEVARLDGAALAAVDPGLDSVVNLNEPAEYEAARVRPAPLVTVQRHGTLATVRAATLAGAAAAVGLVLERRVAVTLNGAPVGTDSELPLVAGDAVCFFFMDTRTYE
ncbi:MAG: molybdenum cofactor guanylyltransferase [Egibacteraceae bacterium]